jgi:Mrp family chromosome partitioning ATPase
LQKLEPAPEFKREALSQNDAPLKKVSPAEEKLRAAFEVEQFPWPEVCVSLLKRAETEFRVFANELMAAAATGSRVVLITSLGRGEGRTTMLLCLGKLLAEQGRNVIIADGDFQQPHLARQLKLLPQAGWDEVLAGEMPLDEALIESMEDHITLMPLRQSLTNPTLLSGAGALEENLKQLARHFELVLVDAGSLDANHSGMRALGAAHGSSSIVVRDMRQSAPEYDLQVRQYMQAAGITRWSLAENFIHGWL